MTNAIVDRAGVVGLHYSAMGLPATLFIGSDGVLKSMHLGEISRAHLNAAMAQLE